MLRIKYTINFTKINWIWGKILLIKIPLLIAPIVLIMINTGLQLLANGFWSSELINELLTLLLISSLLILPIFLVASITGTLRNKFIGLIISSLFWFIFLFLFPKIQNSVLINKSQAEINEVYENEIKKMEILTNFENRFIEEIKKCKTVPEKIRASREWMECFLNNDMKKIENIENEMISKTKKIVRRFHFWSIFSPVTFFVSAGNELSSRGYLAYLYFYKYVQAKKKNFSGFTLTKDSMKTIRKLNPFLKMMITFIK